MKKVLVLLTVVLGVTRAISSETSAQLLGAISVEGTGASPNYYAKTIENGNVWATFNVTCASAVHTIYILSSTSGAKEMYSMLLTAKSTGMKVKAAGECGTGADAGYFNAKYLTLDP